MFHLTPSTPAPFVGDAFREIFRHVAVPFTSGVMFLKSAEHLPRDHHLLHVRRALVDAKRADFAVEALDDMALAHAVAAMKLHGLVDHLLRLVGGVELCHRRLARHARSA